MTIEQFRIKRKNIELTDPAPEWMTDLQANRFFRKIISEWIEQLNESDIVTILKEERSEA